MDGVGSGSLEYAARARLETVCFILRLSYLTLQPLSAAGRALERLPRIRRLNVALSSDAAYIRVLSRGPVAA